MSTNINSNISDASVLEQLANEIFSTLPNGTSAGSAAGNPTPQNSIHTATAKQQPGLGSGGQGGIPPSVAGSGISPSAINQRNAVDINAPISSLQDPNVPAADGSIPQSVAGSGISPSLAGLGQSFNIADAQSAFPNPYRGGVVGQTPESKGYETQNSVNENPSYQNGNPLDINYFDFQEVSPFQKDLEEALKSISFQAPSGQLPIAPNPLSSNSQFYFAQGFSDVNKGFSRNQDWQKFSSAAQLGKPPFDVNIIRNDFPILSEIVNGQRLVWLDNAATTQKPRQVIERLSYYYLHENSNIHRAAHTLAARATDAYEEARNIVKQFINARSTNEIVFVRGTTEGINLIAQSWGDQNIKEGDDIIVSHLEHHANIVPWQILTQKKGANLKVIPVDDNGELLLDEFSKLLTPRTKLVSVTAVSNALGTVTPIKQIIDIAHQANVKVIVDAAQSISHIPTDVQALDADWLVFSGHKIYAPTGIGVVYGKEDLLNATQPWQGGGNMIKDVTFSHTQYNPAPTKFEAGTGNIADAVGLGAALQYVSRLGIDLVHQYETALINYASERLRTIPGLHIIGNAKEKAGAISFVLDGIETTQVGGLLSKAGIAVRAGHHCAQPILRRFGLEATVRPSFAFYNTCSDIDALVDAVAKIQAGQLK